MNRSINVRLIVICIKKQEFVKYIQPIIQRCSVNIELQMSDYCINICLA